MTCRLNDMPFNLWFLTRTYIMYMTYMRRVPNITGIQGGVPALRGRRMAWRPASCAVWWAGAAQSDRSCVFRDRQRRFALCDLHMFQMMNSARFAVGAQGVAVADRAYQQAVAYARERVQGRSVGAASAGSVAIIEHPDGVAC